MTPRLRLILASILFAVLWTAGMYIVQAPNLAGTVLLVIAGALAGTFWFFAMRWFFNKFEARNR
jgi:hypothetical protein